MLLSRRLPWVAISVSAALPFRFASLSARGNGLRIPKDLTLIHSHSLSSHPGNVVVFCSSSSLSDRLPHQSETLVISSSFMPTVNSFNFLHC